jgi:hypothetical protein
MKKLLKNLLIGAVFISTNTFALGLSDYAENKAVDDLFRGTDYSATAPANFYVFLSSTPCSDANIGTELSGGNYARVAIARSQAAWKGTHGTVTGTSSGTNGVISNAAAITFATASGDWTTATYYGLVDTASGAGNVIGCNALSTPRTVTTGQTPSFGIGAFTIQIDNN